MLNTLLIITIFLCSLGLTILMQRFAVATNIVDSPNKERKIHKTPTPLLGGVAVILSFCIGVGLLWPDIQSEHIMPKYIIGVVIGALILLVGGALDDKYDLSPVVQVLFPILATITVIASGIGINYISNPFGDILHLDNMQLDVVQFHGVAYQVTLFADLFTVAWLMGTMYTTKFLDGLDGLVSGITIIGAIVIFGISLSGKVGQHETAWLALIVAAAFFGFLFFNWHPARIFLGESGSLFAGFILGVLAIISGGKIATALLILGIPILDVLWVIIRRLVVEKRSPFSADRKHLHLRLLDAGLKQRQAVLLLYMLTAIFGSCALLLQSQEKVYALIIVALVMIMLGVAIVRLRKPSV